MTPQEIALKVAAEIREKGHYRGWDCLAKKLVRGIGVCLLSNSVYHETDHDSWVAYKRAVAQVAGLDSGRDLAEWNDSHPTSKVLAVLDKVAAS